MSIDYKQESGQILLLVVLIMVVILTVGLSVVTRSITSTHITKEEANSEQAFTAAEAGIEIALQNNNGSNGLQNLPNGAQYQTTVTPLTSATFITNNGNPVSKDEGVDVWLSDYPSYANQWNGTLTVYWGTSSANTCTTNAEAADTRAALDILVISGDTLSPQFNRYAVDPCFGRGGTGPGGNGFTTTVGSGATIKGQQFLYSYTLPTAITKGIIVRVTPLYGSTPIGIGGSVALNSQGLLISSTGVSSNTQRKIVTFKGYPKLPTELFQFVLFEPK